MKGGGFLRIEEHGMSGALELALKLGTVELAIRAVGVLEDVDGRTSFVVVMSVEFTPAIELFLGLTLNAVGGVFGINRTMDAAALTATVRSGRMDDVMFPRDLAARAVEVIAAVKQVFPARVGQVVVGPMLKLGWGRPVSFVTVSVGVVFTFPDPVVIAIIGSLRIALPDARRARDRHPCRLRRRHQRLDRRGALRRLARPTRGSRPSTSPATSPARRAVRASCSPPAASTRLPRPRRSRRGAPARDLASRRRRSSRSGPRPTSR